MVDWGDLLRYCINTANVNKGVTQMRNDIQKLRDAIEAAGLLNNGGSGPIYNDARANGKRRLKLVQAGYFPTLPMHMQWLIRDYLDLFFGERLESVYLQPGEDENLWAVGRQENIWQLCVVLQD